MEPHAIVVAVDESRDVLPQVIEVAVLVAAGCGESPNGTVRNPVEGERDSGMKVNTDSGGKPNTLAETRKRRSPSSRNRDSAKGEARWTTSPAGDPSWREDRIAGQETVRKIKEVL